MEPLEFYNELLQTLENLRKQSEEIQKAVALAGDNLFYFLKKSYQYRCSGDKPIHESIRKILLRRGIDIREFGSPIFYFEPSECLFIKDFYHVCHLLTVCLKHLRFSISNLHSSDKTFRRDFDVYDNKIYFYASNYFGGRYLEKRRFPVAFFGRLIGHENREEMQRLLYSGQQENVDLVKSILNFI